MTLHQFPVICVLTMKVQQGESGSVCGLLQSMSQHYFNILKQCKHLVRIAENVCEITSVSVCSRMCTHRHIHIDAHAYTHTTEMLLLLGCNALQTRCNG
jgi:thymidine kinase